MKILFSNPPGFEAGKEGELRKWVRAGSRWPHSYPAACRQDQWMDGQYIPYPFFMGYAASYVAKHTEADVTLRDSVALHEGFKSYYNYIAALQPDFVFIESASPSWAIDAGIIIKVAHYAPNSKIVVCGPITAIKAKEILDTLPVVACIKGEYEKGALAVVNGTTGILEHNLLTTEEMNAAPFPMFNANEVWRYFDACPASPVMPHAHVWSSRGCPHRCLSGDTMVNTVYGMLPIKHIAENYTEIGVFTYDPVEKRAKVSTAKNIRKTGDADKLVRVNFDDGSHIDCTPDHKFLAFKWGNQFTGEKEWRCEAKDLLPGMHLRAFKTASSGKYLVGSWARRGRNHIHRMVLEWKLGRRLSTDEDCHHKDHNKLNNHPDNLEYMASAKEHFANHPEIAKRMRENNPAKVRWSRRRESIKDNGVVNHRVVSVQSLPGTHDTYCMEVPDTGWFYANNVLVKNCIFCVWPAVMTGNDPDGENKRSVRFYSADYMEAFLSEIVAKHRFRSIYFDDDTFNLGNRHTQAMCGVMRKINLPWSAMCRADTSTKETWRMMRDSGCYGVKLGFESGNQHVVDNIVNKGLDLKEARETVIYLRRLGMTVHGTFTYGLPGETAEQRQETKAYIKTLPLNSIQESGTAEIEGTPLHTLRSAGHLDAYADARMAGFDGEGDGVKKFAAIREELAKL